MVLNKSFILMRRKLSFIGSIFTLIEKEDPHLSYYVIAALHLDSQLSAKEVSGKLDERLLPHYPRWRSAIVGDEEWLDHGDSVKAADHVRDVNGEKSVEEFVAGLMNKKLPLDAPPWRFYMLHQGEKTVLVAQVHHAIGDGISLVETLCEICDVRLELPKPRKSSVGWMRYMYLCLVAFFRSAIVPLFWSWKDSKTCVSGHSNSTNVCVAFETMDLNLFKRNKFTINDVVTAAVSGGLRLFMNQPGSIRFHTFLAVSMRGKSKGNSISYAIIPLPIDESDRNVRLSKVHNVLSDLKDSPEVWLNYYILYILYRFVGFRYVYQKANELYQRSSLVMTNVPGPRLPINFCGRMVEACHFSLAPQKNGFLVSILSYKNNLHISIAGNKMIVGENGAKELIQFIKEEL
jgi:hypothetical protein